MTTQLPAPPEHPVASIVIRAYNEAQHLPEVLRRLSRQTTRDFEVILVDSGSTDTTREIATAAGARVVQIAKSEFTFGRSLNRGCAAARGRYLVMLSGHCYPGSPSWLEEILAPFAEPGIATVYGCQRGGPRTKFSEHRHFATTFPARSAIPQDGFFCNNANCAIRADLWRLRHYDETLTGLEDLDWARWATEHGHRVAYQFTARVAHLHDETWPQVFRRYEREAIALKRILPDFRFSLIEFLRLFSQTVALDMAAARRRGALISRAREIILFRFSQYWGTYRGAHYHRALTRQIKEQCFYPRKAR